MSTDAKFYPLSEVDKELLQKISEDMVGGLSAVFSRKTVVDKTFIPQSTNVCKSIVNFDDSQMHFYTRCQPMPTGL